MTQFTNLEKYNSVFSGAWWKAAGVRAFRTFLIVATTYLPATYTDAVPFAVALSAAGFAAILSIVTSLAGLAEVNAVQVPWFIAILIRVVKTVAQALAGGVLANVVLIQDIRWDTVLATTISAGFGSLLLGALKTLPETADPIDAGTVSFTTINQQGDTVQTAVPVVASLDNSGEVGYIPESFNDGPRH